MKLIRVTRKHPWEFFPADTEGLWAKYIPAEVLDHEDSTPDTEGSFFLVADGQANAFLEYLSRANPGKDVEMYSLEKVGHCPPGEFVSKTVSQAGILPD